MTSAAFAPFSGRTKELGALRRALDAPAASYLLVTGPQGVGKTRTVLQATGDYRSVYHRAPPLPDPAQRAALARSLAEALSLEAREHPAPAAHGSDAPSWEELFAALPAAASEGRALVLVVDDAHRWDGSRARFRPALAAALSRARTEGRAVHVVLVSPELPSEAIADEPAALELTLHPLPFRTASHFLPGKTARERLRAWAVFGGVPAHLVHVDRSASLSANVHRLVLDPDGALADAPLALLERALQNPTRYAAILGALAHGEGDWGAVHAGVPDLSASGQAAPYLKRLEEIGLVEARRSLDASPGTRARRYRVRDAFTAFWFRFVLPYRGALATGDDGTTLGDAVRRGLDEHAASLLPEAYRDFMLHDAMEILGANARECGSLWGPGYDIPVAGTLSTGAPFYGAPVPPGGRAPVAALRALDALVRETRYGFGRERRLRLLFTQGEASLALQREVARRHDATLIGVDALAGMDR